METFSTPEKAPIRSVLKEINANGVVNKSPSSAKQSTIGLETQYNEIDATLSPEHDTTIDTSYTVNNLTCSDLINGLSGLNIDAPVGNKLKPNHHIDANASSDDDLFQECENDLDEASTTVHSTVDKTEVSSPSNESFGFQSNMANSTASLLNFTPNVSQVNNKSIGLTPIVAESSAEDFLSQQESIGLNNAVHSTSIRSDDANRTIETGSNQNNKNETIDIETAGSINGLNESMASQNLNTTVEVNHALPKIVLETTGGSHLNVTVGSVGENLVSNSTQNFNSNETINLDSSESPNVTSTNERALNETVESVTKGNLNETVELVNNTDATPGNNLNGTVVLDDTGADSTPSNNLNATVELPAADSTTVDEISAEKVLPTEIPLNHTIDLTANANALSEKVTELNTTTELSESNIAEETRAINTTFEPPTMEVQPVIKMQELENVANDTFEPMDVDMNDTANFPPPPPEILAAANDQSVMGNESLFNQTIDMQDCSEPPDDVPEDSRPADMNVTIDVPSKTHIQSPKVASPLQAPFRLKGNLLNKTQVLSDEPKNKVELNKTVELEPKLESNLNQTIDLSKEPSYTNQTFVADNNPPMNILNETRNINFSSLPTARRPINANAQTSSETNMNETVVLDNNLPSVNTTFISTEPTADKFTTPKQSDKPSVDKKDETFKVPQLPSGKVANPFGASSLVSQTTFDIPDDEFQSPGLILNSTDFDFLLSKGAPSSGQINPRDSILERFDPISGRKSFINLPPLKLDATTTKLVPTILETSIAESTSSDGNEPLLPIQDSDKIIDLNTSTKLDQNNSGDGDYSQASSTTETYETASIGDPLKTDVTMSVGLIHDSINMDNMKSMEQDMKEQPNLKMNDEQNVNKDMIEDVARKLKDAEAREEALLRRITEKEKALNKMNAVVEHYEKTMIEMMSETEQSKQKYEKELTQARAERDSNFHHLTSLESTFSDLHVKYEKSKQMALEVRENESKLKELCDFSREQMKLQEQRYEKLKNHALTQLEGANAKLEAINKAHSNEIKKLTAQMKKDEISRQSIMDQLAQKTKENEELVKICDELINNGGS